ncbi:MAG: glycerol-3-phosphate dehydrogenase [Chloroflexi bacterium RBG_13_51_18]|nr:MAG: glycerol-3-phosphate dehydrogenase [Chloroflexi bacterium RBG_13_51_18]
MQKVAVIGTTSWGITLATLLAKKGVEVRLWARTVREANKLKKNGSDRFPGVAIHKEIIITPKMDLALDSVNAVILAVPSASMRENISHAAKYLTKTMLIISASKGLELGTNKRMSEIIAEEINPKFHVNICVLSGPQLAKEIMNDRPAASVVAAEDKNTAKKAQKLLTMDGFCVFTNMDVIGVELGGALKNILALGAGIADGLGYGDNAKAAFMTRGLTEITALGMALGANPLTLSGLSGLGDVITTCASPLSRNHYVGVELAKGRPLEEILKSMRQVAEGVNTTLVAHNLAQQLGMEMPITEKIYEVLYENAEPGKAALVIIGGNAKHELSGRRWRLFSLFRHRKRTSGITR